MQGFKRTLWCWIILVVFGVLVFESIHYHIATKNYVIEHPKLAQYFVFQEILKKIDEGKIVFANLSETFKTAKDLFQDDEFLKEYAIYSKLRGFADGFTVLAIVFGIFALSATITIILERN